MGDAGASAGRRNDAGVRRRRNPQGRGILRRGCVAGLSRSPGYGLHPAPTQRRKIPPAQTVPPEKIML